MTESEVFELTTGSGSSDFALLASVLNEHVHWCLSMDWAVNCYVEPVYTLDADIVVAVSELEAIKSDLAIAAFHVEDFPHSVNAQMKGSQLRIQLTTDLRYQAFLEDTKLMEVLGEQVPVASLANIIQGKIWAWNDQRRRPTKRKKDELDLMRILESYPEFRASMPEEISRQVPE